MLAGCQLGGEDPGLVGGQTNNRVVETCDEPAGADLVGESLSGCVRYVLSVDRGRQVDRDDVADGHRPVHRGQGAEPGT
ncbi:Uncharacterised protein [Mycobacterium tuberculosis]|uniref:Uncharacterized protein n=1 Tax=Mycobacterium tuberculosis TaxID=1773 RepID=A0A916LAD6_MYCTX|nr:Uncharacterised protein [Mycobacterium tuberculosis]COX75831.1 Uncharacterised protein [Mycobacterium tuberculosis]